MTDYRPRYTFLAQHKLMRVAMVLLVLLAGMGANRVQAQQDVAFLHYWRMETQWNPAAVGQSPQLSIQGAVQTHAMGYEQAGSTMWAGADMAFALGRTNHGVGAMFLNDNIGLFSHKRFSLQYAYHQPWRGGTIALGLQADMLQEGIDGSKADLGDKNDPAFPTTQVNGSAFDLSVGSYYQRKGFRLSSAYHHLAAPTVRLGETHELPIRGVLNVGTQYNIRTSSPLFTITPSAMLRSDFTDYRVDLTLRGEYKFENRLIFGGINYAPQRSVGLFVGGTLQGIDISYGYEANTSGLGLGAGQHEIVIAYRLPIDLGKKQRNLHKSVRWL
jgi:bacteroidetes-specific putative membrane protein